MASTHTSFGFESVTGEEKARRVKGVFDRVATHYDMMNDVMSAGTHRLWKAHTVAVLNPQPGEVLLDVAGGTGDIARLWCKRGAQVRARRMRASAIGAEQEAETLSAPRAIIVDFNANMLRAGQGKAKDLAGFGLERVCADAQNLPLKTGSVDAVSIGFGLRNIADMDVALAEFQRVLKPGGRFVCLEFSQVSNRVLRGLYDAYSFKIIPALGRAITGDASGYQYLVESIRRFPEPEDLALRMRRKGFVQVRWRAFAAGAVALHSGWKT